MLKKILTTVLIGGLLVATISCNDDEKVDCDATEEKAEELEDDIEDAFYESECDDIEEFVTDLIALYEKGTSCEFVDNIIDDGDYDDFDELKESLEVDLVCECKENRFYILQNELMQAFDNEDCSDMTAIYSEMISVLRAAKDCDFAEELANDEGYNSVDELIEAMEDGITSIC